jgi:hypothetical protein
MELLQVDCGVLIHSSDNQPISCTLSSLYLILLELVHCLGSEKWFVMVGKPLFDPHRLRVDNDEVDC